MACYLLYNEYEQDVISQDCHFVGEVISLTSIASYSGQTYNIRFNDKFVYKFIEEWKESYSNKPADDLDWRNLFIYNDVSGVANCLVRTEFPSYVDKPKDFLGNQVSDWVVSIRCKLCNESKISSDTTIPKTISQWKRDYKINKLLD